MRRLAWLLLLALPAMGGTRIRDTVYYAVNGEKAAGQVTITWPSFKSGSRTVVAGRRVIQLSAGVLSVDLEPNDAAIPAGTSYTVTYQLSEGSRSTEWWVVPTSAGVKTISDVRVTTVPTPGMTVNLTQISQSGAETGQIVGWNRTAWQPVASSGAIVATQAEAEAGVENTHQMTPLRSAQAIAALAGDVKAVGDCASGSCYQAATANYVYAGPASGAAAPAALRALVVADLPVSTRQFVFVLGADNGAVLVDGDDQKQIWWNNLGSTATITKVGCICDGGTPTVMIQRDDGSAANILSGDLSCTTTGATTTSFVSGENVISDGHKIDFVIQAAGGVAKRLTLTGTYTVTQ